MLGPLARVTFSLLSYGENFREDSMTYGIFDHNPENNIEHQLGYFS